MQTFDTTSVTIPNPRRFEEEIELALATYRGELVPFMREAIQANPRLAEGSLNNIEQGSGLMRLEDLVPNALQVLMRLNDHPTLTGKTRVLEHYKPRTGMIFDQARRELTDPAAQAVLDRLDRQLHDLYHQVDNFRAPVAGPLSDRIAGEERKGRSVE